MREHERTDVYASARGWVIAGTLVLCAVVYSFSFTSFLHPKLLVLCLSLVVLAIVSGGARFDMGVRAFAPIWIGLAAIVAVHVGTGAAHVPHYVLEAAAYACLPLLVSAYAYPVLRERAWRRRMRVSVVYSCVAVGALGILQYAGLAVRMFPAVPGYDQRVYSVFGNQDLFGGYVAAGIPLAACLFQERNARRTRWLAVLVVLIVALLLSGSRSAWLAAALGLLVNVRVGRASVKPFLAGFAVCAAAALVTALAAPAATRDRIGQTFGPNDTGYRARLWIWDGSVRMAASHPLVGVGPGNFRYWSPHYLGRALHASGGDAHYRNELHTLHAHSDFLELFAESGLVGLGAVAWMFWRARRCRGPEWGAIVALVSFASVNAVWYSPPHALCGVVLLTGLLARTEEKGRAGGTTGRAARYALGLFACSAAAFVVLTTVVPSYRLNRAESGYDPEHPDAARFRDVSVAGWPNPAADEALAMALITRGELDAARAPLERARQGLDTGRIHYLLALVERDPEAAKEAVLRCLDRWPGYGPAWKLLAELSGDEEYAAVRERARRWLPPAELAELFENR